MVALTASAWAATTFTVENLNFTVVNNPTSSAPGTCTVAGLSTAGKGATSLALSVPGLVTYNNQNYHVTGIESYALQNATNLKSVTLRYGIQTVGSYAFSGCSNITYVRIPSSIKVINSNAFQSCSKLAYVYLAKTTTNFSLTAGNAFPTGQSLTLYLPWGSDVNEFAKLSIFDSTRFKTFKKSSEAYDFSMTSGAKYVVTKAVEGVNAHNEVAIIGCAETGNDFANGVWTISSSYSKPTAYDQYFDYVSIADSALAGNTAIKGLNTTKATKLTTIGNSAFNGATALASVVTAVGTIQNYAFFGCTALKSVTLNEGVKTIAAQAFARTALTSITLPASVTSCSAYFVDNSTSLTDIGVNSSNANYSSYSSSLYNKAQTYLYRVPCGRTSVIFPSALTTIGSYAMENCAITSCYLPYGVKTINNSAFSSCKSLTTVRIPSSVTELNNAFQGCSALNELYINMPTPPTITASSMFSNAKKGNLFVPYGKVDAYKNAGWSGMASYNSNGVQAYDVADTNFDMTVTSSAPVTLNGTSYAGRCKIVRGRYYASIKGTVEVPKSVLVNGKNYAVTCIGEQAVGTANEIALTGAALVDSVLYQAFDQRKITSVELPYASYIGEEAFDDCTSLKKVTFGPRLKRIEKWGFCNDPIEHDLIMPYGFQYLGYRAFQKAGSKRLLIPGSCTSCNQECFRGMKNLTELIINITQAAKSNWSFDFTDVPSACKVLVPTGQVQQFRNHADWKKFGNNIGAGAFDFNYGQWTSAGTSGYHMTITSTTPVTVDGVTYDGKAKYVYYPTIGTKTGFACANSETDNMYNSGKKYLITEIGDSCLFRASGITAVSLENLRSLARIGAYAFTGSGVKTLTVPENCTSFGYNAFYGATSLEDLTILGTNGRSWDGQFIGNNASNFTMYVHFQPHYSWYNSQMGTWTIGSKKGTDIVNPYIPAENTTQQFASVVPIDFSASGVNAYIVTGYNTANATLTTQQVQRVPAETGVIITDLTPSKIYKMKRPTSSVSAPMTNYLASSASVNTDVYNKTVGFYWNQSDKKFVKPTGTFYSGSGRSYLMLTSNAAGTNKNFYLDIFPNTSAKKGDVNADGKIDVVDLNIVINIILGSDQASKYNGRADVTGDSKVDIVDVNAVINLILGV